MAYLWGLIPSWNDRQVRRYTIQAEYITSLEPQFQKLTDAELRGLTDKFRQRLADGETIDEILPEAFAAVREASVRTIGKRHFDVQLMGGMVLHEGRIAEMKTGEGKTLVATLPLYLNALDGKGCHLVTVNDYLAKRDSEWMGPIYRALGLTVGVIVHDLDTAQRKEAYGSDITYGTNNEFGFDYLRDNMGILPDEIVQRGLHFAIVDEVDSILIDEARTPLIISGPAEKSAEEYIRFAQIARLLKRGKGKLEGGDPDNPTGDYTVDEKAHTVVITEEGGAHAEKHANVGNLYDPENMHLLHYLMAALKAKELYKRDTEYIVSDQGEIIIVDEFTGRLMPGRRWSDGIHQSVEAKEGVKVQRENQTLATITFQNYFRLFKKLGGMTGTAKTEEREFADIYKLDVVVAPTHRPMVRDDMPDIVFRTEEEKYKAIVGTIGDLYEKGQPVLVGTRSIDKSEMLAERLRHRGVPCNVLNAKHHAREAEIVSQSGRYKQVTIATNMAGRGTDIILGGNPEFLAKGRVNGNVDDPEYPRFLEEFKRLCAEEHEKVVEAGGLYIIGTERHDSRRIDDQLRGRSGRQGDPGASQFYLSMEDELMRLFGGPNIRNLMDRLGWEEGEPLEHRMISNAIERAQKRVENHHYEIRKQVLKYDDVMNEQRNTIYAQRQQALKQEMVDEDIRQIFDDVVETIVMLHLSPEISRHEWNWEELSQHLRNQFGITLDSTDIHDMETAEVIDHVRGLVRAAYVEREAKLGVEQLRYIEKMILLQLVDEQWKDHLYTMDGIQEGIHLKGYAGKDPLVEYKIAARDAFNEMMGVIKEKVSMFLFRLEIEKPSELKHPEPPRQKELVYSAPDETGSAPPPEDARLGAATGGKRPGRNDPCDCGSGLKYKKCHGAAA
ncbi:MAG: preprotein translocase subunit SecA [Candidatus Wallbacteria bacterium]|nr:preprotein translocase subunit SecA [Candidatus Wallbacteria bacterium]